MEAVQERTIAFGELTEDQLAALSDVDVERYIDLACAEEGVRLLPEFNAVPPVQASDGPDIVLHEVGGMFFRDVDDARQVARLASVCRRWAPEWIAGRGYSGGTESHYYVPAESEVGVTDKKGYSKTFYEVRRAVMDQSTRDLKHYEEQKREWDGILGKRNEVRSRLWQAIEAARGTVNRRSRLRGEFARYLELADCDITIARRFLLKAYPDAQELDPALFSNEPPPLPPRGIRTRPAAVSFEVHNQQGE